jgi:hypothetical protein
MFAQYVHHGPNWRQILSDDKVDLHMNGITWQDLNNRYNEDAIFGSI